jgi:mRNA interferase MazF
MKQTGERPIVVLQDPHYGSQSPVIPVAPFSSRAKTLRFAGTSLVKPDIHNGLRTDSIVLVFQLRALDRSRFLRHVGQLSDNNLTAIYEELDRLTGRIRPSPEDDAAEAS